MWHNKWATETTGRAYFAKRSKPKKNYSIKQLYSPDQSLIFQFRTGHSAVNIHLNRLNQNNSDIYIVILFGFTGTIAIRSVLQKDDHIFSVHVLNPREDMNLPEDYEAQLQLQAAGGVSEVAQVTDGQADGSDRAEISTAEKSETENTEKGEYYSYLKIMNGYLSLAIISYG